MFFQIANIQAPSLMPSSRMKRMRFGLAWLFGRRMQAIQLPILCHNAPTGSWRYRETELLQRREHAIFAQQRVLLLLLADQVARRQPNLGLAGIGTRFVREAMDPFLHPAFEDRINRRAGHVEIPCNRRNTPTLCVQVDHRQPALCWISYLGIRRVLPSSAGRSWPIG
jgi:hypothetical protein